MDCGQEEQESAKEEKRNLVHHIYRGACRADGTVMGIQIPHGERRATNLVPNNTKVAIGVEISLSQAQIQHLLKHSS